MLILALAVVAGAGTAGCASGNPGDAGWCGDGFLQTAQGEECDDGNAVPGDGCSLDCVDETGVEADCANGLDDDQDGRTDCEDPGCATSPLCQSLVETSCVDSVDNDGDGAIDCDDTDCAADPYCYTGGETVCDNGVDDDADGKVDCGDSDCDGRQCAAGGKRCQLGSCLCPTGQSAEVMCGDGVDDDCDGLTDCIDPDCFSAPSCLSTENICDDGADNDGDGSADCLDSDCAGAPCDAFGGLCAGGFCVCPGGSSETLCSDGLDNDCDGLFDCADSDCSASPGCAGVETSCANGVDDDGDGSADCLDSDCAGLSCDTNGRVCAGGVCSCPGGSSETLCSDGLDNDCDGLADCLDSDCASSPSCVTTETNCTNGVDDDGDGQADCADSDCNGTSCGSYGLICTGGLCQCPGGTTEICGNGVDDNCNGQADENCGGGPCTLPLSPSLECGSGYHCIPQPGVGSQGLCSSPTGVGGQYSYCTDNSSCADIYECVNDGTNLLCLQWCTSYLDCPDPPNMDCYPLSTPVYIGTQEWGICYFWP